MAKKKKIWQQVKPIYLIMAIIIVIIALAIIIWSLVSKEYPVMDAIAYSEDDLKPAEDHIIVKFKKDVSEAEENSIVESEGVEKEQIVADEDTNIVTVPQGKSAEELAEDLQNTYVKEIEYTELDYRAGATMIPNDPMYSNQYFLPKVSAPGAWDISQGNKDVVVAVLDTGVAPHKDVSAKYIDGYDFVDNDDSPIDGHGHGTFVSGVVAAVTNNNRGVAGSAPNVKIMPVKVLSDGGWGYYSWVASGIRWAADNGADVINMSLGGSSSSATLQQAINYAHSKGVTVVAAAGNSGSTHYSYPGACAYTIGVGATDSQDRKASFSNYGDWVDVMAPGVNIFSTRKGGSYGYWNGTSFSSPITAALASLIKSRNSNYNPDQIELVIEQTADDLGSPGKDIYFAWGRVNFYQALNRDSSPPPTIGMVRGKVINYLRKPVEDATVEVRQSYGGQLITKGKTLSDGTYSISDINADTYYLRVIKKDYQTSSYRSIDIYAGRVSKMSFSIRYKYSVIYGRIYRRGRSLRGVSLLLYKNGRPVVRRTSDRYGRYNFQNRTPARYTVVAKYGRTKYRSTFYLNWYTPYRKNYLFR